MNCLIYSQKKLQSNLNTEQDNHLKSKLSKKNQTNLNLNSVETARSIPKINEKDKFKIAFQDEKIGKVKGALSAASINESDNNLLIENTINTIISNSNLKMEKKSVALCCVDFDRKCIIF